MVVEKRKTGSATASFGSPATIPHLRDRLKRSLRWGKVRGFAALANSESNLYRDVTSNIPEGYDDQQGWKGLQERLELAQAVIELLIAQHWNRAGE